MLGDLLGVAARAAELARQVPGVRETTELARQVPGVREAERVVEQVQRGAIREMRELLDQLDGDTARPAIEGDTLPHQLSGVPVGSGRSSGDEYVAVPHRTRSPNEAGALLIDLLDRSLDQNNSQARQALYQRTLRQLVPDEARILAALSDGSAYPMVDLVVRNAVGAVRHRVLEYVSTVGRSAGVALPDEVPVYVGHLRSLGLIDIGPEDPALADRYEVLMTEEVIRRAQSDARNTLRAIRGTLRLSALGWALWRECMPEEEDPAAMIAPGREETVDTP